MAQNNIVANCIYGHVRCCVCYKGCQKCKNVNGKGICEEWKNRKCIKETNR